nr:hypothetical protein [Tanacetum cinerariifolium]
MLPVTQIDTFYKGLTLRHRDTINAAAGGTFMKRRPEECYDLIENMTAHHNDWDTSAQRITPNYETCGSPHSFSDCPATVGNTQNVYAAGAYKGANQGQNQPPAYQAPVYQAPVHQTQIPQPQVFTTNDFTNFMKVNDVILKNMQTNMTSLTKSNLELKNMFGQFMKMNTASSSGSGTLPGNTITNPKEDLKGITTRRGTAYPGPIIPTTSAFSIVKCETNATKDTVHPTNNESTEDVQPPVVQSESLSLDFKPGNSPIIEPVASPVSALRPNFILMPKFGLSIKILLTNKDKLCKLAKTPLNEHYSAVLLKKLPEKLGDPDKFLIPCDFPRMAECLALVDLGASINLMPLSVWNKLSLPDLSLMYFDVDPRVPLILGRPFLKTERALINVFEGELTLLVGKEAITFNLDQTSRYSARQLKLINQTSFTDSPAEEVETESNIWDDGSVDVNPFGDAKEEYPFVNKYLSFQEEPIVLVEEESCPVYDINNEEYVIEEEEGFIRKGGFGGEEDNIEDVVVVANGLYSLMIQTILSVDFEEDINTKSHELWSFEKSIIIKVSQNSFKILICKKYQEWYLKAPPMVDKLGLKTIKVQGRVVINKGNLMQGIQIWMLRVQGTSETSSRTSFFQVEEGDTGALDRNINMSAYLNF